jgi:hypothetical protein
VSAEERLAAALGLDVADVAGWPSDVARRYADGEALDLLRGALPVGCTYTLTCSAPGDVGADPGAPFSVDVERDDDGDDIGPLFDDLFDGATIAAAAHACRVALKIGHRS